MSSYSSSDNEEASSAEPNGNFHTARPAQKNLIEFVDEDDDDLHGQRHNDDDDDDFSDYYNEEELAFKQQQQQQQTDDNDSESFYDATEGVEAGAGGHGDSLSSQTVSIASTTVHATQIETTTTTTTIEGDYGSNAAASTGCIMIDQKYVTDIELYDDEAPPEESNTKKK
jgi:hypothetical protein